MKYKINTADNPSDLELLVNSDIEAGWQPLGDVQVSRVLVPGTSTHPQHVSAVWVQVVQKKEKK